MGMIQKVLAGDAASLEKAFEIESSGVDSAWGLALKPKDAVLARFVKRISVKGGAHVNEVEYLEANGDRTHIAFSEVTETGGALSSWPALVLKD